MDAEVPPADQPLTDEPSDNNEFVCGGCTLPGELICCERCPAAFHWACAGYGAQRCIIVVVEILAQRTVRAGCRDDPVVVACAVGMESDEASHLHQLPGSQPAGGAVLSICRMLLSPGIQPWSLYAPRQHAWPHHM